MQSSVLLRVVLDTNVVLSSISRKSPYRIILDELIEGKYEICISTDILLEYEEKITELFDKKTAELVIGSFLLLNNIKKVEIFYKFNIMERDKDDNKFLDCAFAGNVHYLVTDDKHFNVLKKISFPKINLIKIDDFQKIVKNF